MKRFLFLLFTINMFMLQAQEPTIILNRALNVTDSANLVYEDDSIQMFSGFNYAGGLGSHNTAVVCRYRDNDYVLFSDFGYLAFSKRMEVYPIIENDFTAYVANAEVVMRGTGKGPNFPWPVSFILIPVDEHLLTARVRLYDELSDSEVDAIETLYLGRNSSGQHEFIVYPDFSYFRNSGSNILKQNLHRYAVELNSFQDYELTEFSGYYDYGYSVLPELKKMNVSLGVVRANTAFSMGGSAIDKDDVLIILSDTDKDLVKAVSLSSKEKGYVPTADIDFVESAELPE